MRRAVGLILGNNSMTQPRLLLTDFQQLQQARLFAADGWKSSGRTTARSPQPPVSGADPTFGSSSQKMRVQRPSSSANDAAASEHGSNDVPSNANEAQPSRRPSTRLADTLGLRNRLQKPTHPRNMANVDDTRGIGSSHESTQDGRGVPQGVIDAQSLQRQQQRPTHLSQQYGSDPNRVAGGWKQRFAQRVPLNHRGGARPGPSDGQPGQSQGPAQGPSGQPRQQQWRPRQQTGASPQRGPLQRGHPSATSSSSQKPFRSTAGGGDQRPFRRRNDDVIQLSLAEKAAWRAEYMGFIPEIDQVYDKIEEENREAAKEVGASNGGEDSEEELSEEEAQRIMESFTEEDWEEFREYKRSVIEAQDVGLLKSDKQHEMLDEWAEEVEALPPPPDQAKYVFESEEDRSFHRSMELDYQPEYNFVVGPPRRRGPDELDPVKVMQYYKPGIMHELGIGSEKEYDRQAEATLDGIDELLPTLLQHDAWVDAARLDRMAEMVPESNDMAPHIRSSVEEIKKNPFWRQEQKELFISRLIRDASSSRNKASAI